MSAANDDAAAVRPRVSAATWRADADDRACAAALAGLPKMTPHRLAVVLEHHRPAEAWPRLASGWLPERLRRPEVVADVAPRWRAAMLEDPPARVGERLVRAGVAVVLPVADGLGAAMAGTNPPVTVLFARGRAEALGAPGVAVVGTRRCTSVGREFAHTLGHELACAGVAVVSGLALGIDAAAHAGALDVPGAAAPIAVVGTGVDVVYPRVNAPLWSAVAERGLLLSEHPPGTRAEAHHFPQRNRIIAALASLVVVVESHRVGGALITASVALDLGRVVGAVPGSPRNSAAEGTNELLRDGASIVLDTADALAIVGLRDRRDDPPRRVRNAPPAVAATDVSPPEQLVLDVLGEGGTVDELVGRSGAGLDAIVGALDRLDERGLVMPDGPGWRRTSRSVR